MKIKEIALILFILVSVGLGIGLIAVNQQAASQHKTDTESVASLSNQLNQATLQVTERNKVIQDWEQKDTARKTDIAKLSNDLAQVTENLAKSDTALKAALEETAKRDAEIAKQDTRIEQLDKQSVDLRGNISTLELKIADTQKKLTASEGDKAFLEKELQRLVAEKSELERQFNDLAVLKDQVRKLKEELTTKRRIEWMRQGIFAMSEQKGAQRLMQGSALRPAGTNNYDLNVEVKSDGGLQVIPPITNSPSSDPK